MNICERFFNGFRNYTRSHGAQLRKGQLLMNYVDVFDKIFGTKISIATFRSYEDDVWEIDDINHPQLQAAYVRLNQELDRLRDEHEES